MAARPNDVAETLRAMRSLYATPASAIAKALPDIGDGLAAQCAELARNPTAPGCDQLAANLEGTRAHLVRLRAALLREQGGHAHD